MSGSSEKRLDVRRVVSATGDLLVVEGATPVPVGTRVSVAPACVGLGEPGAGPLHGKVIDVRRTGDAYAITLRLHNVTRAQREALDRAAPTP